MIEIKGKYTSAKIFTDNIEEEALSQIYDMCNHPAYENIPLRFMADVHSGNNCCIGTTFPLGDNVKPAVVGCDIGCTISVIFYDKKIDPETYPLLEHKVKSTIPFGFEINDKRMFETKDFIKFMNSKMSYARSVWPEMVYAVTVNEKYISDMLKRIGMDEGMFYKSLGSVGGGRLDCHRMC